MSSPHLTAAEIAAVTSVLTTTSLSLGPQLTEFERSIAAYVGTRHAVGVNSGTSGLHLCMIASGIGEGDWVLTTPFSFVASANCILYEHAVPLFVDVEYATGNIDPTQVADALYAISHIRTRQAVTSWLPPSLRDLRVEVPRLKAMLPVHAFGQPAELRSLAQLAREYQLYLIEDACEALGAEYRGVQVGTFGDAAVFAFYPNKQMTTGEGGMIVTRHEAWDRLLRSLRNQGRDTESEWLAHSRLGYNYRLDEMSAALGSVQLQRIEELIARRERVAQWYIERLAGAELVELPYIAPTTTRMSWFTFVVRIRPPAQRDLVIRELAEAGIPSRPYFTPIHLQSFYRERFGYARGAFPVTEKLGDISLALPFSGVMSQDQVDEVCAKLIPIVESTIGGRLCRERLH